MRLMHEEAYKEHPKIKEACLELEKIISDKEMQDLNYAAAKNGEDTAAIAKEFLLKKGLIKQ